MNVRTGIDIVDIPAFQKAVQKGGTSFLDRCFHEDERGNTSAEHLSGIFAAKEAVVKALSLPAGSWLNIRIKHDDTGRPVVVLNNEKIMTNEGAINSIDISISHTDSVAAACCVVLLK